MNKENIFKLVVRNIQEVIIELEGNEFNSSDRLVDLGANSVDRAEIIAMTMESLSLQIPRLELFGVKNIGELVEVLYEKFQPVLATHYGPWGLHQPLDKEKLPLAQL